MDELETDNKYNVPILERSMEILELLGECHTGMIIQEICNTLKISKSSVYRIVNTFQQMGYLTKDKETNRFILSRKMFRLGLSALSEANMLEYALNPMKRLRDDIKESVMLGSLVGDEAVLMEQVLGSHDFTFMLRPGAHLCLYASAPGKTLMAYQNKKKQDILINSLQFVKFNENTITDADRLRDELIKVKENGYAVDVEEEIIGVHCIGAPIFNQLSDVVASIWVSGPKGRMPSSRFPEFAAKVQKCANEISIKLGYNKNLDLP